MVSENQNFFQDGPGILFSPLRDIHSQEEWLALNVSILLESMIASSGPPVGNVKFGRPEIGIQLG